MSAEDSLPPEQPTVTRAADSHGRVIKAFVAVHLIAIAGIALVAYSLGDAAEQGMFISPEVVGGPTEPVAEVKPAHRAHAADELAPATRVQLFPVGPMEPKHAAYGLPPVGLR